jgi:hypothetical protein
MRCLCRAARHADGAAPKHSYSLNHEPPAAVKKKQSVSLPDFQIRVPEPLRALPSLILINQSDLGYYEKKPFPMR